MLVLLEAVLTLTGYNFVNGSLRDNYYWDIEINMYDNLLNIFLLIYIKNWDL
jgi:hypothetical protein